MKTATKSAKKKSAGATRKVKLPVVNQQPLAKSAAAAQRGMFLFTDDNWSRAYFNKDDLHYEERELFG